LDKFRALTDWSLTELLSEVGAEVERNLSAARKLIAHSAEKGGATEEIWRMLLRKHLPARYQVDTGFIVDSRDTFSDQIDIVVFDRQYSPLVFELGSRKMFPAESVYAVFEVKQTIDVDLVLYARQKVGCVRKLYRTNLPVRDLSGNPVERPLLRILGGVLSLESNWSPPFGEPFKAVLAAPSEDDDDLDLGCVASRGWFQRPDGDELKVEEGTTSATAFLFHVISRLQESGTVPMIDMSAYAAHLPNA
jgi:hypothetical protein